jgi:hypothetical protein
MPCDPMPLGWQSGKKIPNQPLSLFCARPSRKWAFQLNYTVLAKLFGEELTIEKRQNCGKSHKTKEHLV